MTWMNFALEIVFIFKFFKGSEWYETGCDSTLNQLWYNI